MGLFDFLKKDVIKRMNPEDYFDLTITDRGVIVQHPQRKKEEIKWSDIIRVRIITTDQGPFQPDVWIVLVGIETSCHIPQGAKGYEEVYNIVSQYNRFNFENVVKAMSSTANQEFLVWSID